MLARQHIETEDKKTDWIAVSFLTLAAMMAALQIGKGAITLPAVRTTFDVNLSNASWLISVFNVIGVLGGVLIGQAADRYGYRRVMLIGLTIIGTASLAGAQAHSFPFLLATRLFEGLGFMLTVIAGPPLVVRVTNTIDRRLAFGFWGSYMPAGAAAMILSSFALSQWSWRSLWYASAIAVCLSAAGLAFATGGYRDSPDKSDAGPSTLRSAFTIYGSRGPLVLGLTFAAYTTSFLAILGLLPTILIESDGIAIRTAAIYAGIAMAFNALGTLVGGGLLQRGFTRPTIIACAAVVMALSSFVAFAAAPFAIRYLAVLTFSLVSGLIPTALFSGASVLAPSRRQLGATNGLMMQGSNLGQVIGPPVASYLAQVSNGWRWTPTIVCVSAIIIVVSMLILARIERRSNLSG